MRLGSRTNFPCQSKKISFKPSKEVNDYPPWPLQQDLPKQRLNLRREGKCCHGRDQCFSEKLNYNVSKIAKFVGIFVKMEPIKNQGVIYCPARVRPVFPTLWSSHPFTQIVTEIMTVPQCEKYQSDSFRPIYGPQFVMCSISTNIPTNLAIY